MNYILPLLIFILIFYSLIKNKNAYNSFVSGAKEAFNLSISIFPYLCAIFIAIELINASGVSNYLSKIISPIFTFFNVPNELSELVIIKHLSGSGSLGILQNIYQTYGCDSYIGKCASVIMGSSEAIMFVLAVYFSKTNIKKFAPAIIIAILANFLTTIFICQTCKIF